MALTERPDTANDGELRCCTPPFLLGLISGGAVIYWFTGASTQAVTAGAYRAVEFIKANIKLDDSRRKASIEDSKKRRGDLHAVRSERHVQIFLAMFFMTLAFACIDAYFFIGYLISIAIFGLYQAIFMANAGGAWDNAKKIVEVELARRARRCTMPRSWATPSAIHSRTRRSVALNPVIKFTTLFGLLAVELAIEMPVSQRLWMGALLCWRAWCFVWRSFYKMRMTDSSHEPPPHEPPTSVGESSL